MSRRHLVTALVPALLVLACAGRRAPEATPEREDLGACREAMPPVRDIDTYADATPPAVASPWLAHSLDREPLRRVVREHQPELRACYEAGLLRDPHLSGRIDVRWTIQVDTSVSDVVLAGTTLDDACVVRCVLEEVATWSFPGYARMTRELRITYPFRFERG